MPAKKSAAKGGGARRAAQELPKKLYFNVKVVNSISATKKNLDTEKDAWPDLVKTLTLARGPGSNAPNVDSVEAVTEMIRAALPPEITKQQADLWGVAAGPVLEKDAEAFPELTFKVVLGGKGSAIVLGGEYVAGELFCKLFGFEQPSGKRLKKRKILDSDSEQEEEEDPAPIKVLIPLFLVQVTAAAKPGKGGGGGGAKAGKAGKPEKPYTVSLLIKHPARVDSDVQANTFVCDNPNSLGTAQVIDFEYVQMLRLIAVPEDDQEADPLSLPRALLKLVDLSYRALGVKDSSFFDRHDPRGRLLVGVGHNAAPVPNPLSPAGAAPVSPYALGCLGSSQPRVLQRSVSSPLVAVHHKRCIPYPSAWGVGQGAWGRRRGAWVSPRCPFPTDVRSPCRPRSCI